MVWIKCGWCHKEFDANVYVDKRGDRIILKCPHCSRTLPSSKKVSTGQVVGKKHYHDEYVNGDTA